MNHNSYPLALMKRDELIRDAADRRRRKHAALSSAQTAHDAATDKPAARPRRLRRPRLAA